MDQAELETVVPQPGGTVLVVSGPHRGARGTLVGIDTKKFKVGRARGWGGAAGRARSLARSLSVRPAPQQPQHLPHLPHQHTHNRTGCPACPQAEVKLRGGAQDGRSVWLEYEDFSRWQGTFK